MAYLTVQYWKGFLKPDSSDSLGWELIKVCSILDGTDLQVFAIPKDRPDLISKIESLLQSEIKEP